MTTIENQAAAETQNDERLGLPSASAIERINACPGSFLAEQHAPKHGDSSPEADTGTRIHARFAGELGENQMTADELVTVEAIDRLVDQLEADTYGKVDDADRVFIEKRFWLTNPKTGEKLISGKPDLFALYGTRALVVDYKTGRNAVEHAMENLQLRTLVAILDGNFHITEATVAIVQPWAPNPENRITKCTYGLQDILQAKWELRDILRLANEPTAARIAGTHCTYCKAKAVCPEARDMALEAPVQTAPGLITPEALAAALTNDTLGKFLDRAVVAEKIIAACKDEAKRRLEEGTNTIPGWKIKPGTERETVTDPQTVFERFELTFGGTGEQFLRAVTVQKTKLKDILKTVTGAKGKSLEAHMETLLTGCVETKITAPSLARSDE